MKKLLLIALVICGVMSSALNACCHRCYNGRVLSETTELVYPE